MSLAAIRFGILLLGAALAVFASVPAMGQAQETVLYSFENGASDGTIPNGDLLFDSAGNIYGTTQRDGTIGAGTVFELSPQQNGGWTETVLYHFCSLPNCLDGAVPEAGLISDSAGNLYGTTALGGNVNDCNGSACGTAFELSPPGALGGAWTETVLWNFKGGVNNDGAEPFGKLVRDAAGNLYGTTEGGGSEMNTGSVFELSPSPEGAWAESILYAFCANGVPCPDGAYPVAGVFLDKSGNLFGTTIGGGFHWGVVFQLSPKANGTWTESTLHEFEPQTGGMPFSAVSLDPAGNLYGTVSAGSGAAQCGGAWRLTNGRGGVSGSLPFNSSGANGCGPASALLLDIPANTAFGTAPRGGGFSAGTVYKITGTKQSVLYDFCQESGCSDGSAPGGSLTQRGKALYGTTSAGGAFNQGVVFEITH